MVREPSVEDTIAILRGLKDKYEVHHKVKIKDTALVAAAVLSHRYIGDRFLPDKAIDLVDEAAARIRMQIDSMPQEIDEIERRVMQLQIERVSLAREDDAVSRERLAKIDAELAELREGRQPRRRVGRRRSKASRRSARSRKRSRRPVTRWPTPSVAAI
jgi:ATP-dependent Clp protease ATP-binding subunit ClpB